MDVHVIIMHFKELLDATSRTEKYETSKKLFCCKITRGSSVNPYVLRMIENFIN
jgi:hypothetical protein|uniref:Uncharacterized protein n=1 Tax=Populus trichocarpa TaxID=3694 RepID=A9PFU6_POPTR|nr:unknown [Populus trichocarpa]